MAFSSAVQSSARTDWFHSMTPRRQRSTGTSHAAGLLASEENYLFVSLRRNRLCYQSVCKIFHSLVCAAGIQREPHLPQPRIHSLRHTFAVRALENCPVDRDRINQHILALSTYMGHSSLESTFWYLDATPQLLTGIATAWEVFVWEVSNDAISATSDGIPSRAAPG